MENIKSTYESVVVLSLKLSEEGIEAMINKIQELIEKNATLNNVDKWGKRKLAYLINKEAEAYYVLFDFTCGADFPAELDRVYKITDGILRSLIIKKED